MITGVTMSFPRFHSFRDEPHLVPYPRIGKRINVVDKMSLIPYPRIGRASAATEESDQEMLENQFLNSIDGEFGATHNDDFGATRDGENGAMRDGEISAMRDGEISATRDGEDVAPSAKSVPIFEFLQPRLLISRHFASHPPEFITEFP